VSNPKSKIPNPKSPRGAQPGNQNASKHRGGSRRISATVPVELAEWLAEQPNQSAAVVTALWDFRLTTIRDAMTFKPSRSK
jgi:hypothetical protein